MERRREARTDAPVPERAGTKPKRPARKRGTVRGEEEKSRSAAGTQPAAPLHQADRPPYASITSAMLPYSRFGMFPSISRTP